MYKSKEELPMFLTVMDVANLLGISRASAYELVREDNFPKLKIVQGRTIIPRDRLLEWLYEQAREMLRITGLSDKENAYPCQLSGGQQQRVAIARALMMSPEILCFDEPTSALDPELTGEVLKVIKSLKDSDRTMIIVTHEMDFARSVSDKVIFVADGVIEEMGTPDEVLVNPKSEKIKSFLSVIERNGI